MTGLRTTLAEYRRHPGYTLMRGAARFGTVRHGVSASRRLIDRSRTGRLISELEERRSATSFPDVDIDRCIESLRRTGLAEGLSLSEEQVREITLHAESRPLYADRDPHLGFELDQLASAEQSLGKPILVAQYMNTRAECAAIRTLAEDPVLRLIATGFLGSTPKLVGTSLWWTFPVAASDADRDRHAHRFHHDVDDFAFLKFFFYITPVSPDDGGHVCVRGSHQHPPRTHTTDRFRLRRYSDEEIESRYPPSEICEITGPAGAGFAENTLCVHKGLTPTMTPRLLLQFEFALFDYGVADDRFADAELSRIRLDPARR